MIAVPMSFVFVVGIGVALLAILQILVLGWLVDAAKSARRIADNYGPVPQPLQLATPKARPDMAEYFKDLAKVDESEKA